MLKKPYDNLDSVYKSFPLLYGEITEEQKARYERVFASYKKYFNENSAYIASSSGRVEVLGNHTDHNGGKVISCAISLDTIAFFLPINESQIILYSEGYEEIVVNIEDKNEYKVGTSKALIIGVMNALKENGYKVGGFKAYCSSNVLGGAGISSSASFEVLIAEIFNFLYNDGKISNEEKAKFAQFAENVYFGKPCGLLDQTAIAFGGLNKLDFNDKKAIKVSPINCDLKDYVFVLVNTGGSHENLTDEYASIPKEMFEVAKVLSKERLIDIDSKTFYANIKSIKDKVSDRALLRAIHFYTENDRVDDAEKFLIENNYDKFLSCVKFSGISSMTNLQNCYVSTSKDQSIPKALAICSTFLQDVTNRVHGGGFAGTILNVVKLKDFSKFFDSACKVFGEKNVISLKVRSVGTIVL